MAFRFTEHALAEMARRGIERHVVEAILSQPEQIVDGQRGRKVYQSRAPDAAGTIHLIRLVVDEHEMPMPVITVYRTSKIDKYWRP